MTGSCCK